VIRSRYADQAPAVDELRTSPTVANEGEETPEGGPNTSFVVSPEQRHQRQEHERGEEDPERPLE
jgi:hypothetical protein